MKRTGLIISAALMAWLLAGTGWAETEPASDIAERGAQVIYVLPFLILLVCPLLHLFMHRGHGGDHAAARSADPGKGVDGS